MAFVRESTPLELAAGRIAIELLLGMIDWDEADREAAPYGLRTCDISVTLKQFRGWPHWDLMRAADAYGARKPYELLWDPVTEEYLQQKIAERRT
jgi:hypothetical protein